MSGEQSGKRPIVSSAHLVSERAAELSEFEFGLIIASLVNLFLQSSALYWAVSVIGVFIFVGLTAYDTQAIRQMYYEADSQDVATKKAVFGALRLYLDFINLFLMLLRLFGNRN